MTSASPSSRFIRTTDPDHYEAAKALWQRMEANGDIYLSKYAGWYSVRDERYFVEDETEVQADGLRYASETGTEVTWTEEESYFFKLSAYQDRLLALYADHPDFGAPHSRFNEVISFVKGGLEDLSISRTSFDWGVPVPGNPDHVMYVWVDALTNYLTGVGFPDTDSELLPEVLARRRPRDRQGHLPLPRRLLAGVPDVRRAGTAQARHDPRPPAQPGRQDVQVAGQRGGAGGLGGAVRPGPGALLPAPRGAVRRRRQLQPRRDRGPDERGPGQQLRQPGPAFAVHGREELRRRRVPFPAGFTAEDAALLGQATGLLDISRAAFEKQEFSRALEAIWNVLGDTNAYFAEQAPWVLRKTDVERMNTVLYVTLEVLRIVAILAQPVMPTATAAILDSLGQPEGEARDFAALDTPIVAGTVLPAPAPVFPKYEEPAEA